MKRKDYDAIAEVLRIGIDTAKDNPIISVTIVVIAEGIANRLELMHDNFNKEVFYEKAGVK